MLAAFLWLISVSSVLDIPFYTSIASYKFVSNVKLKGTGFKLSTLKKIDF